MGEAKEAAKVLCIDGRIEERDVSIPSLYFDERCIGFDERESCKRFSLCRNMDGSVSLFLWSRLHRCYAEAYVLTDDGIVFNDAKCMCTSYGNLVDYPVKQMGGAPLWDELLRRYGHVLTGFNEHASTGSYADLWNVMELCRDYVKAIDILPSCPLPPEHLIDWDAGDGGLESYAFIQRTGAGSAVARLFSSRKDGGGWQEHSRMFVYPGGTEAMFRTPNGWRGQHLGGVKVSQLKFRIYGVDDLEGTRAGYCMDPVCKDEDEHGLLDYGSSVRFCMCAMHKAVENLSKIGYGNVYSLLEGREGWPVERTVQECFGQCDASATSFAKMAGIPQSYLPIVDGFLSSGGNCGNCGLRSVSYVLAVCGRTMEASLFDEMLDFTGWMMDAFGDEWMHSVKRLIGMKDSLSLRDISDFVQGPVPNGNMVRIEAYLDYLYMYVDYGLDEMGFKWNPDDIWGAHDEACDVIAFMEDEDDEREYSSAFEEVLPFLKGYEHAGDGYVMVAPSCVMDIIKEGKALSHCVRTYLDALCGGRTAIMFLRRREEPDRPFFTVEIRDGRVRQCHGMCNCDVSDGVREWLDGYCEKLGIEKLSSNLAYGADE